MIKIPKNLNELTDMAKTNVPGVLDRLKSVLGGGPLPEVQVDETGDPVLTRLSEINKLIQQITDTQALQATRLNDIKARVTEIYGTIASAKTGEKAETGEKVETGEKTETVSEKSEEPTEKNPSESDKT